MKTKLVVIFIFGVFVVVAFDLLADERPLFWTGEQQSPAGVEIAVKLRAKDDDMTPSCTAARISELAAVLKVCNQRMELRQRLNAIKQFGPMLNEKNIATLYDFLKSRVDTDDPNLPGTRALKNNVLNALRNQDRSLPGLADLLIGIYHDKKQDGVVRDYAVQHLISWAEQAAEKGRANDVKKIQLVLEEASQDNSAIVGTALLGMHRLSSGRPGIKEFMNDGGKIDRLALYTAGSKEIPTSAKITAMVICGERGVTAALPLAEEFAVAAKSVSLQVSAIAVIGRLGGARQRALLWKLKSERSLALDVALDAAIDHLEKRETAGRTDTDSQFSVKNNSERVFFDPLFNLHRK